MADEINEGENVEEGEITEVNETEELAKQYGWRPLEDFDLDPEGFVGAEKFLEFPSTQTRILRDENANLKKQIDEKSKEYDARFDALAKSNQTALERQQQMLQQQYEADLKRNRDAQVEAVQEMDTDRFQKLKTEEEELRKSEPVDTSAQEFMETYRADNEWVNDPVLWKAGIDAVNGDKEILTKSLKEQVEFAAERVKDLFPHKFADPEPEPPVSKVDPGGLGGPIIGAPTERVLPPEAKAAAKEFIQMGLYKTEAEYAKDYFSGVE